MVCWSVQELKSWDRFGLGDHVRVGANSVVNTHVPLCSTVVGIPGRIVRRRGVKLKPAHGIDLDHHLIPDPVGRALACVMERLDKLEEGLVTPARINSKAACAPCDAQSLREEPVAAVPVYRHAMG